MPPKTVKDTRPRIWAEGSQNPPLQPRAFALASVRFARESLSGLLRRCAVSADDLGEQVKAGRWRLPEDRLGRTGRYLPSARSLGRSVSAAADVLARAAAAVFPSEEVMPKSIFTAEPAPVRAAPVRAAPPAPPRVQAPGEDPELQAIRAMIGATDPVEAPRATAPAAQTAPVAAPLRPKATGWRREWLADTAARFLGYGLLVLSVPVGAVQAAMAHLNGEDLRKLVDEV